jgi:hypothetical protein
MKFSNDPKLIEKYDARTISGMRYAEMEKYGLGRNWYGGALRKVGELKDSPVLIMIGENNKTLAIAVQEDNIAGLTAYEASSFKVPYLEVEQRETEMTRKEMLETLKGAGVSVTGRETKAELSVILDTMSK